MPGATVEVFVTDPATGERRGAAVHRKTVGADGRWGPFTAPARVPLEFVITRPGYAATHIYRSPFPRSSQLIHLRAERIAAADKDADGKLSFSEVVQARMAYFEAADDNQDDLLSLQECIAYERQRRRQPQ